MAYEIDDGMGIECEHERKKWYSGMHASTSQEGREKVTKVL